MIIRVRTPQGMYRVTVGPEDTLAQLLEGLAPLMKAPAPDAIVLTRDPHNKHILAEFEQSLTSLGLNHGDMLYGFIASSARPSEEPAATKSTAAGNERQEPVDNELEKIDGMIDRSKDSKMCKHGANAMCEYCMPIEPYDAGYLAERGVKHMSFHAYLRKILSDSKVRGDISGPIPAHMPLPLEDPDFRVKPSCQAGGHAPWPEGICSKCQPSAITLQRQPFRMVDNVEFASASLVERLLSFWRTSGGCQRFGMLYGKYERASEDVPLGIKAVVEAIYEPRQKWEVDGIKVNVESPEFDEEISRVDKVAASCGLRVVGMVFTDTQASSEEPGKVLYKRHANSYFLTSMECRLAAFMEIKYPNVCRWSRGGHFGSKFVTCCVSGNAQGEIDLTAWQLSNTAMAMQRANLIVPSNEPSKMCVLEATKARYVPDIFYRYTNEYNLPVTADAKPAFPVEYMLVNLTQGAPMAPNPLFKSAKDPFVIENRDHVDQPQTLAALKSHLNKGEPLELVLSDFHLLVYLGSLDVLGEQEWELIGNVVCGKEGADVGALVESNGWKTLMLMLQETNSAVPAAAAATSTGNKSEQQPWACRHCTFDNSGNQESCEMCGLPKD